MPGPSDPSPPWAPAPEVRRRRREGWIIAGIIVAVTLLAIAQFRLPQSLGSGSLGTDAILIGLINVNLILLVLLVFLVGRNIAKLIFERRRRIMGSHLRTRLVVAFVAIALLPATLLFLVGLVFVGNSIERWFNGQVERSIQDEGKTVGVVVVDSYVPFSVVVRRDESERAFNEYLRLKIQRRPIQTNYTITLAVVTIVVLFSATWFGFYLARGITVPIQRLAEGTRAVAHGDLDHRIEGEGEDEIGTLVTAFNRMTAELKTSRTELESRRRYLETVLANITAGVVSADAEGRVTTINRAAESLLGLTANAALGLRRRYSARLGGDGVVFDECTRTIIEQVEDLKALVNEFSTFARMPTGAHTPQDLNRLVDEALVLFREGHREIEFVFAACEDLP